MTTSEQAGRRTVGGYTLLTKLGEGGMGVVHLARRGDGDRVALKVLRAEVIGERHRIARFQQEARAASALSHPNICHIYHLGETSDEGGWSIGESRIAYMKKASRKRDSMV